MSYTKQLLKAIPGGCHTYSKGYDQFPANAPQILERGKDAFVFDEQGRKYLDYGMGLRSVVLGYAQEDINQAAIAELLKGNNLTRPSLIELEAAQCLIDLIESIDMVKFAKNGSSATTAAVKLSRAYTGKTLVARCAQQPFFSYDDWFIGSTPIKRGIPASTIEQTKYFNYNDIASLQGLFEQYPNQIACVILEPSTTEHPQDNFLHKVQALCIKYGAVFVLDEMVTGFRWHLRGAQHLYAIEPDLCTFGKAMANGFSLAAVGGKREIMQLGSTEFSGQERVFLLSSTHGAEMSALGAFVAVVDFMKQNDVIGHLASYGAKLKAGANALAAKAGIGEYMSFEGLDCNVAFMTKNAQGESDFGMRTLFAQEMIRCGVLMPWVGVSYAHKQEHLEATLQACEKAFRVYAKALQDGYEPFLEGEIIKPVFRQFN